MRLDKFLANNTPYSRSDIKKLIGRHAVQVNGQWAPPEYKVRENDRITLEGQLVSARQPVYLMLHKPPGYECSTRGGHYPSALELIDLPDTSSLHFAGRLDADTTGLVLVTDDGQWSHAICTPRRNKEKVYRVRLASPLSAESITAIEQGLMLNGEKRPTRPARLRTLEATDVELVLTEGKYHQVKRMFAAVGNAVVALHRSAIGPLRLDASLQEGQWRFLTADEVAVLSQK